MAKTTIKTGKYPATEFDFRVIARDGFEFTLFKHKHVWVVLEDVLQQAGYRCLHSEASRFCLSLKGTAQEIQEGEYFRIVSFLPEDVVPSEILTGRPVHLIRAGKIQHLQTRKRRSRELAEKGRLLTAFVGHSATLFAQGFADPHMVGSGDGSDAVEVDLASKLTEAVEEVQEAAEALWEVDVQASSMEVFDFHGDELLLTQKDGFYWVSVRRICEVLGLDVKSQRVKLEASRWATMVMNTSVGRDGRRRNMSMLRLDKLYMWLAGISVSRVKPEIADRLVIYQELCADVLAEHFLRRRDVISPQDASHEVFAKLALGFQELAAVAQKVEALEERQEASEARMKRVEGELTRSNETRAHMMQQHKRILSLMGARDLTDAGYALHCEDLMRHVIGFNNRLFEIANDRSPNTEERQHIARQVWKEVCAEVRLKHRIDIRIRRANRAAKRGRKPTHVDVAREAGVLPQLYETMCYMVTHVWQLSPN